MTTRHRTLTDPVGPYLVNLTKYYAEQRPDDSSDCIIWTGSQNNCGYGLMGSYDVRTDTRRMITPHRLALVQRLGRDIQSGMNANHTCHNRLCVNPDHLTEGSQAVKVADMRQAGLLMPGSGRPRGPGLGKQNRQYRYTEEEIQFIRDGDSAAIAARWGWTRLKAQKMTSSFRRSFRWLPHPRNK